MKCFINKYCYLIIMDILIKNVRISENGVLKPIEILIQNEKIAGFSKQFRLSEYDKIINGKNSIAIPGGIDMHVHFRDPGSNYKENWYTGSRAAAAGGITTVADHPNTNPATLDKKSFEIKQKLAKKRSVVDYGINSGVYENIEKFDELWDLGALAFGEIFMGLSTGGMCVDNKELGESLEAIKKLNALPLIHAEDEGIRLKNLDLFENYNEPDIHSRVRPNECEEKAVFDCLEINRKIKGNLHFCHMSTPEAVKLIEKERNYFKKIFENKKQNGLKEDENEPKITAEVAPHHLFLTINDWPRLNTFAKMNPPIRDEYSANEMMKALNEGKVNAVASDHAPHTIDEKSVPMRSAPSGVPGVETLMPLMLAAVKSNKITLNRLIEVTSRNPARILNIERHGKGLLKEGYDADIILFDPKCVKKIKVEDLHSKCNWTPYEGIDAIFPNTTIVRGEIVWDGENITKKKGYGKFLPGEGKGIKEKKEREEISNKR